MVSFFNGVISWLVVEPTHLKNMLVKMGSSSLNRGENKKYLSCHHLGILLLWRVIKNLLVQQWISYGPSLPVKYVKALHRLNHTANHGNQDCRPYSEACPQKKTDPILTLSTRANPDINQLRNRNKQQTMKVFIQNHNKKRVSHGFFLIQIHPVTTWRSASLPNNLRCDMTFNSWITLMVSLAPGPRQLFFKTSSSGLLGSPSW